MHSLSSPGATAANRDDEPAPGFEIGYHRDLLNKKSWRLGFEALFGYTDLNVSDASPISASITRLTDTFTVPPEISGQPLPPPGYQGSFAGIPGGSNPVIGSVPARTFDTLPGMVTGARSFGADLFNFRFGPTVEFPLGHSIAVNLSGGF